MQIITGYLKGQTFNSPKGGNTHPMGDKIRGALFNILGDIKDLTVLDAFAGSGAIGFEALSRGAASTTLLESNRLAQKVIEFNIHKLGLNKTAVFYKMSADSWLSKSGDSFDIVILDPPYDHIQQNTILLLAEKTKIGGILVLSLPPRTVFSLPDDFENVITKTYGDAQLRLYRRAKTQAI